MKITKQQLIEMVACKGVWERFIEQTNNTEEPVEVTSLIGGKNTIRDLLWLAGETLPKDKIIRFACDCALINIELIKPYTNKYDDIVNFLKTPTADASDAACYAASTAANAAAYAADAAADAIHEADAVEAAIHAADAAQSAAVAGNCKDKINELLIKLFTGEEVKKITALPVERDEDGYYIHQDYDKFVRGRDFISLNEFEEWLGINDLEYIYEIGEFDETYRLSEWEPESPEGEGWFVGAIYDSEEGPSCIWFRNL